MLVLGLTFFVIAVRVINLVIPPPPRRGRFGHSPRRLGRMNVIGGVMMILLRIVSSSPDPRTRLLSVTALSRNRLPR